MDTETYGKEQFVADGRQVIERGMRSLADQPERSAADIRRGRQLTGLSQHVDALEADTEPPSSPEDDRIRDIAETVANYMPFDD